MIPMSKEVQHLVACRAEVAEGPIYDTRSCTLFWVDIPAGHLWQYELPTGKSLFRKIGQPLGSIALIEGGGFLLAAEMGLLVLPDWAGTPQLWQSVEPELPTQFNDGKCDTRGRFVAGTASRLPGHAGTLYRIDTDGTKHQLFNGIGMSNGLDWSPDDRFFYHVDTSAQTVTRYLWDSDAGVPHDPILFIDIPSNQGLPDGLSIDQQGYLWLAVWGSGQVRRYSPEGQLVETITLPTPNVSSCTFGGPNLSDLYITTAAQSSAGRAKSDAIAGDIFVVNTTCRGQDRPAFPRQSIPDDLMEIASR